MPSIGSRCHELRINDQDVTWRIMYRIDEDALVIAEVFAKKTQQTPKRIIDVCKRRLADYDAIQGSSDMDDQKKKRLEAKGWKVGDAADFLELSAEEAAYIDLQIALGRRIREARKLNDLTQQALADGIGSSQSRVAKMESGDPSVSLDLQIRALLTLGLSRSDIAAVFASDDEARPQPPVTR